VPAHARANRFDFLDRRMGNNYIRNVVVCNVPEDARSRSETLRRITRPRRTAFPGASPARRGGKAGAIIPAS
jgi:hypothetical protein